MPILPSPSPSPSPSLATNATSSAASATCVTAAKLDFLVSLFLVYLAFLSMLLILVASVAWGHYTRQVLCTFSVRSMKLVDATLFADGEGGGQWQGEAGEAGIGEKEGVEQAQEKRQGQKVFQYELECRTMSRKEVEKQLQRDLVRADV
ncbi:hypothetical protein CCMSSC00406_0008272 [Pleurotus cornucopiae]|uniref:Uncharacterized protein n=1 Tax=Pleurotus cornucopiae TaxID=5321 RepID=A0ACB7J983_PLECO|nr:hypothetical protein CCMSSC00406_0008272 [Pleurotus cornucopiae]